LRPALCWIEFRSVVWAGRRDRRATRCIGSAPGRMRQRRSEKETGGRMSSEVTQSARVFERAPADGLTAALAALTLLPSLTACLDSSPGRTSLRSHKQQVTLMSSFIASVSPAHSPLLLRRLDGGDARTASPHARPASAAALTSRRSARRGSPACALQRRYTEREEKEASSKRNGNS
jgi:hypothetical protein